MTGELFFKYENEPKYTRDSSVQGLSCEISGESISAMIPRIPSSEPADALGTDHIWRGPFPELDRYGAQTGHQYVQCIECGTEALAKDREHASHYPECPYALDSTV